MREIHGMCQYCTCAHTIKPLLLGTSINGAARPEQTSSGAVAGLSEEHAAPLKSIGYSLASPLHPQGSSPTLSPDLTPINANSNALYVSRAKGRHGA